MNHRLFMVCAVTLIAATFMGLTSRAFAQGPVRQYRVGVAKVDITPKFPVRLHGYATRREEATQAAQRIWAKGMAIDDGVNGPVVLVTVDNLGVPISMTREIAARLSEKHKLKADRFVISASHTHTAPMLNGVAPTIFGQAVPPEHQKHIDQYTKQFAEDVGQAASDALHALRPAKLTWGVGKVKFAANRRPQGGPVDHDLPMLVAKDTAGKPFAIYLSYACHCTTLGNNKISGDWSGYAQEYIEQSEPGAMALISIGCGADSNPPRGTGRERDRYDLAQLHGREIALEVHRLLASSLAPIISDIEAKSETLALPLEALPSQKSWEELAKLKNPTGYHASVQLDRLKKNKPLNKQIEYPILTWRFGKQLAMVFLPGEVVVDYSLRLKRELDSSRFWVNAYCNDSPCYIPSERVLREGGYEGGGAMIYYDQPTRFQPGLEQRIVDVVHRLVGVDYQAKRSSQPALSAKESQSKIRVKPGLEVQLVASEPNIVDPVAIDFGPDGKLWVVEMRDYPSGMDGKYKPGGTIRVLEDRDGDGKYERSSVFLDNLPFPTGLMVWRKGVLICAAPDVLYAEDTNGDGKADVVHKLLTGFATHNYQARVNSLQYGLDNWVYAASGLFGGKIRTFTGKEIDLQQRDFRFKPDTGEIEVVSGITQQGRVRDDWGNWFGCDNSVLIRQYPLIDRYVSRNPHFAPPSPNHFVADYPDSHRMFPATEDVQLFKLSGPPGKVTAACGLGFYRDELIGKEFQGNAFVCEPVHLLLHRLQLQKNEMLFSGRRAADEQQSEFLTSTDRWFRPVQMRTGPDGAIWIVDMYRYVIEHPRWIPPQNLVGLDVRAGDDKGRIYRLIPKGTAPRIPRLSKLSQAELVNQLASTNGTVRDLAQMMIVWNKENSKNDSAVVNTLRRMAKANSSALGRLHAICTLDGLHALDEETLFTAIQDKHAGVQAQAIRLAEPFLDRSQRILSAVLQCTGSVDAGVRMQLAYSLGESKKKEVGDWLGKLIVTYDGDPYLWSAYMSSVQPCNVAVILDRAMQGNHVGEAQIRDLIATAAGIGDRKILAAVIASPCEEQNKTAVRQKTLLLGEILRATAKMRKESRNVFEEQTKKLLHHWIMIARAVLRDPDCSAADRIAAVKLIAQRFAETSDDTVILSGFLDPRETPEIQTAAIAALTNWPDAKTAKLLIGKFDSVAPAMRNQMVDAFLTREAWLRQLLQSISNKELRMPTFDSAQREIMLRHQEPGIRQLASRLLGGAIDAERAKVIDAYQSAITIRGDTGRGRALYKKNCSQCHRLDGMGFDVGPDLAGLTDRSTSALLVSILDPNRAVDSKFVSFLALTNDGQTFTGILANETATTITLRKQEAREQVILRKDIESLRGMGVSFMPEGFEKDLRPADFADLAAFIASLQPRKLFTNNIPAIVTADKSGRLVLTANNCEIYGKDIAYEPEHRNIGYWHGESDRVEWTVRLEASGDYNVQIEYACAANSAGNAWILDMNPALRGRSLPTSGWSDYRKMKIGSKKFSPGVFRISMRPDGPLKHEALLDLREIVFIPSKSSSAAARN